VPGARCSTLRVPLDRTGGDRETLSLRVAIAGKRTAPVLVFLSGGPGEPGLPFLERARAWLGPAAAKVRLVAIDQRGTGDGALQCPALQKEMGASDLTPPSRAAVTRCADQLGARRRFFTTADTVADLEALRIALHTEKLALDGISYGTYVAQRYALAHPDRVSRLVLDSVVPAEGVSLLSEVSIKATRRVLGKEASEDLATVVRDEHNGPQLLDMLTSLSVGKPRDDGYLDAIDQASKGDDASLRRWLNGVAKAVHGWKPDMLSQGLHASTLCADSPAPWGDASAPIARRIQALDAAAAKLGDLYPYDRETATGNGLARQCLYWPPTSVPKPAPAQELPAVPVLLLAGDRDLSTPLEWTRQAAMRAPKGRLLVVKGAGHSVQSQGDRKALAAVRRFVASRE
jgi:pimeloyl-ACP methyl ester carboxylesterase